MRLTKVLVLSLLTVLALTGCSLYPTATPTSPTPATTNTLPPEQTPTPATPAANPSTNIATPPVPTPPAPIQASKPAMVSISISNFSFNPTTVTIAPGSQVTWTNNDSAPHTITGDGGLDSGTITNGGSFSFTFATAGTYSYHCSIHPSMQGQIIVK